MPKDRVLPSSHYPPTAVDRARSTALAHGARAQPRECYSNAYRAMMLAREAVYVEGYVASSLTSSAIQHAWLEIPETRIILDPTPSYCDGTSSALSYFAGQRWTREDIRATYLRQRGATFPLGGVQPERHRDDAQRDPRIVEGWRRAASECHRFRAAHYLERYGTPMSPAMELAHQRLITELSGLPDDWFDEDGSECDDL